MNVRTLARATLALSFIATVAAQAADVKLWRLDCGAVQVNELNAFSDTLAYTGKTMRLTASCYLIKHDATYLLWDTGLPTGLKGQPTNSKDAMSATVTRTIAEQLADLKLKPEQINYVGISHYHFDHIGQASAFGGATLLIGKGDWDAVSAKPPAPGVSDVTPLKPWLEAKAKVEPVSGDKDVFGDGSVVMLDMPGHTPGHHSLLVRLAKKGTVLLSGDLAHFTENYASDGVPAFNFNRADTLASLDRFKKLAKNLNATVIIQHESRDIPKLPTFPSPAE